MSIPMTCRINELFEANPTGCEWHIKNKIGEGQQAKVYSACCNNDEKCNYAVKVYENINEKKFNNEVNIQYNFDHLNIGVPIVEAFYCPDHGAYIIMERLDMTVSEYISKLLDNGYTDDFIMNKIESIRNGCKNIITIARNNSLVHDDANINNFMLNVDGSDYNNLRIIDFANAFKLTNDNDNRYSIDYLLNDLNQTIDLLIKDYKNKRQLKDRGIKSLAVPPPINRYTKKSVSRTSYNIDNGDNKRIKYSNDMDNKLLFKSIAEEPEITTTPPIVSRTLQFDSPDDTFARRLF